MNDQNKKNKQSIQSQRSKPKIFIGIQETGDYTLRLAQGFRELGFEVTHLILKGQGQPLAKKRKEQPDKYIAYNNWTILQPKLVVEFLRNFLSHDIFIFNFGVSFFSTGLSKNMNPFLYMFYSKFLDWKILKALGKKIVVTTLGCDVRHYIPMEKWAKKQGIKFNVCMDCDQKAQCSLKVKKQTVKMIEKYADHIFTDPNFGQLFTRPYSEVMVPINLNSIKYKINKTNNPLILHAPTKPAKKGTKYIVEAIEKLREEGYKFRFLLCQNMHHEELIEKMVPLKNIWSLGECGQILSLTGPPQILQCENDLKNNGSISRSVKSLKIACASYGP